MEELSSLTLQQAVNRSTIIGVALAVFVGIIRFRSLSPDLRWLAILNWFELPIEVGAYILILLQKSNLFLMPIYTIGEFAILTLVYRQALRSAIFDKISFWLIGAFAAYSLVDSFWTSTTLEWFRPGQQVIQSLLILGLVTLYFRKLLNELSVAKLSREPMFWVSIGLTVYFLGYLQIALFSNYLLQHYSAQLNANVWTIQSALHIFLHLCYAYALWMRPQK